MERAESPRRKPTAHEGKRGFNILIAECQHCLHYDDNHCEMAGVCVALKGILNCLFPIPGLPSPFFLVQRLQKYRKTNKKRVYRSYSTEREWCAGFYACVIRLVIGGGGCFGDLLLRALRAAVTVVVVFVIIAVLIVLPRTFAAAAELVGS